MLAKELERAAAVGWTRVLEGRDFVARSAQGLVRAQGCETLEKTRFRVRLIYDAVRESDGRDG